MNNRPLVGALLCVVTSVSAIAQAPFATPKFRDRQEHGRYWSLVAPNGLDSLRLSPTTDARGAVSQIRYETTTGYACEVYVRGGQIMSSRVRHPGLHKKPQIMGELLVAGPNDAFLVMPLPPFCPVLTSR